MERYTTNDLFEDMVSGTTAEENGAAGEWGGNAAGSELPAGQTPQAAGQKLLEGLPCGAGLCRMREMQAPLSGVRVRESNEDNIVRKGEGECCGTTWRETGRGRGKRGMARKLEGGGRVRKPLLQMNGNADKGLA